MDPRLRRELDPARADRPVGLLDEVELLRDRREKAGDLCPGEVEQAHISWTRTGSITTFRRSLVLAKPWIRALADVLLGEIVDLGVRLVSLDRSLTTRPARC